MRRMCMIKKRTSKTLCFPLDRGMKIVHLNVRGLRNKTDLEQFFKVYNPYDIMSLFETWIDEDIRITCFLYRGF